MRSSRQQATHDAHLTVLKQWGRHITSYWLETFDVNLASGSEGVRIPALRVMVIRSQSWKLNYPLIIPHPQTFFIAPIQVFSYVHPVGTTAEPMSVLVTSRHVPTITLRETIYTIHKPKMDYIKVQTTHKVHVWNNLSFRRPQGCNYCDAPASKLMGDVKINVPGWFRIVSDERNPVHCDAVHYSAAFLHPAYPRLGTDACNWRATCCVSVNLLWNAICDVLVLL